jgi:bifunctional non-homologous end joining protein LigD
MAKFIVVKHEAKRAGTHYDLRFEMPNSNLWASFAVRKGVPLEPGKKVLAVRTHDHSREEALFLGTIASGYGAGKFTKWDDGNCIVKKFTSKHIVVDFKGKKIKGLYHLINTGVIDREYKKQNYLLFKSKM